MYIIWCDYDFGISALGTSNHEPIVLQYSMLIVFSAVLSWISFFSSCVLSPKDDMYSSVVLGVEASNAGVGTALVQALGSSDWGAQGNIVQLLKYLIQYQIFITYVNVAFQAILSRPDIKLPEFVQKIIDVLKSIDDHINNLLEPLVEFVGWLWDKMVGPLHQLWDYICNSVGYVLSPLKYPMAYVVVIVGRVGQFVFHILRQVFDLLVFCLYYICVALYVVVTVIFATVGWVVENLMITPVVWSWDNIVVLPTVMLINGLISSCGIFQMCYDFFCFSSEGMQDAYGWMEVTR